MAYRSLVSDSTALSATETTEKLIDTLDVPSNVSRIIGCRVNAFGGAGMTTVENITGKFRLRNKSSGEENEFLLDCVGALTSGAVAFTPHLEVMDMPVKPGEKIEGYAVLDLAQTITNTVRFQLIFS